MIGGIKIDIAQIPKVEIRVFCAVILNAVLRFYEDPGNVAEFERWLIEMRGGESNGQETSDKTPAGIPDSCAG